MHYCAFYRPAPKYLEALLKTRKPWCALGDVTISDPHCQHSVSMFHTSEDTPIMKIIAPPPKSRLGQPVCAGTEYMKQAPGCLHLSDYWNCV